MNNACSNIIKNKYECNGEGFSKLDLNRVGCNFWRGLCNLWNKFHENCIWQIGNGTRVFLEE